MPQPLSHRRTFAIISHPDAGKTTLTEKLLLYGGAIHLAGAVKAKKNQKHTTADWMEIEKARGITISASVLQFSYDDFAINILDTPGHKDFSEDTYRTLTAVDAAVMLIDAGKGVEAQTRKLFEVCRMRGLPIFTFMNKMDRPSRDPLDLIDELEKVLNIRSCPMTWPLGMGDRLKGVYDRRSQEFLLYQKSAEANAKDRLHTKTVSGTDDPQLKIFLGPDDDLLEDFQAENELLEVAGDAMDLDRVRAGELTPVFFGSALTNFGVEHFLREFLKMAPPPTARKTIEGVDIDPSSDQFSGQVFKIQANMDPAHRDRVAFIRVCSGRFEKNMQVKNPRLKKPIKLSRPLNFFAQERVSVDEAFPGDIVGIVDTTDSLRIGDTIHTGPAFQYQEVPRFSPEHFATVEIRDPMKRKQLEKGLEQLTEEGVIQIYYQKNLGKKDPILAAVGVLQFEVLKERLRAEYSVDVQIQTQGFSQARWLQKKDSAQLEDLEKATSELDRRSDSRSVLDRDKNPVILFKSDWAVQWSIEHYPLVEFSSTAPIKKL